MSLRGYRRGRDERTEIPLRPSDLDRQAAPTEDDAVHSRRPRLRTSRARSADERRVAGDPGAIGVGEYTPSPTWVLSDDPRALIIGGLRPHHHLRPSFERALRDRVVRSRRAPRTASVVHVSRTRTERLVNLVICLLSTRRFLTAAQIAATVPGLRARRRRSARARGVPAQVRARQGRAARPRRAVGDRDARAPSTPSPATGSPAATTPCPTSTSSRTRRPPSASRPGCGSTPGWPPPRPRACSSCAPPGSTSICRPRSGSSRW